MDSDDRNDVRAGQRLIGPTPSRDVAELMAWLAEYHARLWDRQIEADLEAGRLDGVLAEVDEEYRAGLGQRPGSTS